jgi:hypothetical protein
MVIEILFFIFLAALLGYGILEHIRTKFDRALILLLNKVVNDLRKGINIKGSLALHSKDKGDPAERLVARILELSSSKSLGESFRHYELHFESQLLLCFSRIVRITEESRISVVDNLNDLVSDYSSLRDIEISYQESNLLGARVIQFLGVFGLPTLVLFLHQILEIPVTGLSIYFMGYIALLYGTFDFFMFSNWKKLFIAVPLFFLGFLLVMSGLSDWVAGIFLRLF